MLGSKILLEYCRYMFAFVVSLLKVPPDPSQGPLPWLVEKSAIPLEHQNRLCEDKDSEICSYTCIFHCSHLKSIHSSEELGTFYKENLSKTSGTSKLQLCHEHCIHKSIQKYGFLWHFQYRLYCRKQTDEWLLNSLTSEKTELHPDCKRKILRRVSKLQKLSFL